MKLQISNELSLPKETVTSTFVIYGGKGMGKTNLASVLCEELHRCKLRFSYLDPVGVAWGLRSSADGKSAGLEILILGGKHGDIPIDPTAGALVADFVVDENVNVIVDFSRHASGKMWGAGEKIRFVTAYTNRLFERQGEKRQPLMQIYDEAGRFVPQIIPKGAIEIAECIGAIEQLVELGRNVGIGVTLITQRSARMNKSVSELADVMIAFRTVGPRSVAAIDDWLSENIGKEERANIIDEIRSLPIGKAMIVSPGWLQIQKPVQIRPRQTFDSSATPKPGEQIKPPKKRAEIDLGKYRERMAETIARATQDNPAELRKQIAQLRRELAAAPKSAPTQVETQKVIEKVPIITNGELRKLEKAFSRFDSIAEKYRRTGVEISEQFNAFGQTLGGAVSGLSALLQKAVAPPFRFANATAVHKFDKTAIKPAIAAEPTARWKDGKLPKAERSILSVLAQYPDGRTKTQVAIMAHYAVTGGGFQNAVGALKSVGYVSGDREMLKITENGLVALGDWTPLPTGQDLLAYWLRELPKAERSILAVLAESYPSTVTKEDVAVAAGYEVTGGGFQNAIGKLRTLELIHGRNELKASDVFFE